MATTTTFDEPVNPDNVQFIYDVITGAHLDGPLLPGEDALSANLHPQPDERQITAADGDPYGVRLLMEVEAFLSIEWRSREGCVGHRPEDPATAEDGRKAQQG